VFFYTDVASVALHLSKILYGPHDLHVLPTIRASANFDLECAGEQFGPPVIFDLFRSAPPSRQKPVRFSRRITTLFRHMLWDEKTPEYLVR
jgi:hypothetical protein